MSTISKKEMLLFLEQYKGKKINISYESNFCDEWVENFTYDTAKPVLYEAAKRLIETHYIHNIKIVN